MKALRSSTFTRLRADLPKEITLENIQNVINTLGIAPISELVMHFHDGIGDVAMVFEGYPNLVAYLEVSKELATAILALLESKDIAIKTCSPMLYYISGLWPMLPMALKVEEYDRPHWLPVCLCSALESSPPFGDDPILDLPLYDKKLYYGE